MKTHFEDASNEDCERWSRKISISMSNAMAFQTLDRREKTPQKDAEALRKAQGNLRRAAGFLGEVSWQGGSELKPIAASLEKGVGRKQGSSVPSSIGALEAISNHLELLAEQLGDARGRVAIKPDDSSISLGAPKKIAAENVSITIGSAFLALSGRRPTVTNNASREGTPRSGAFFSFIAEMFDCLGMQASPATWADMVEKHFREV